MIKKLLSILIIAFFAINIFLLDVNHVQAADNRQGNICFFLAKGCPHCAHEEPFLDKMKEKYPEINIVKYEVWTNAENLKLMQKVATDLHAQINGVPLTVIGERYVSGWVDENVTGPQIEDAINCAIQTNCPDVVGNVINNENQTTNKKVNNAIPKKITVPIFGEINTEFLSLPVLTVVLGLLDGFNPCAMWTLIFLITLLLGLNDKKRMWILGGAFIVASAVVYFMFMSAWLNLILFLGFVVWIRIIIGIVALFAGGYNLKEYRDNKEGVCKVTSDPKQQKIFAKLKKLTQEKNFWLALVGIILLAFAVNLVEAICSAGIPAVYTQVLAMSHLNTWQYYGYILLYIFFFMLDDLIVFTIAMFTLEITGLTGKFSKYSHLIGGIVMLIIGLLLLFRPEWLMFG